MIAIDGSDIRELCLEDLRQRTSILITHRTSLAELDDMVVVLEDGCVLESAQVSA